MVGNTDEEGIMTIWTILAIHVFIWSCIGIYDFSRKYREYKMREMIMAEIREKIHTEESFMNIVNNMEREDGDDNND